MEGRLSLVQVFNAQSCVGSLCGLLLLSRVLLLYSSVPTCRPFNDHRRVLFFSEGRVQAFRYYIFVFPKFCIVLFCPTLIHVDLFHGSRLKSMISECRWFSIDVRPIQLEPSFEVWVHAGWLFSTCAWFNWRNRRMCSALPDHLFCIDWTLQKSSVNEACKSWDVIRCALSRGLIHILHPGSTSRLEIRSEHDVQLVSFPTKNVHESKISTARTTAFIINQRSMGVFWFNLNWLLGCNIHADILLPRNRIDFSNW